MRFSGSLGIPFGDFYREFSWGPGAGIEFIIPATPHTSIRLGVSRVGLDDNADSVTARVNRYMRVIEDNLSVKAWKVSAAAEYRKWHNPDDFGGPAYCLYGGVGILHHSLDGHYLVINEATQQLIHLEPDDRGETRFIVLSGAGGMLKLGRGIGLDVTGEVNLLIATNDNRNGAFFSRIDFSSIVEIKTGLVFLF